jgi:hypothetical protein
VATLTCAFLSQAVARRYHLSVDFTDGQMLLISCLVFFTPALTLAVLVAAAFEWRLALRQQVMNGLMLTCIPAVFLLLAMARVGLLQRAVQWLTGA